MYRRTAAAVTVAALAFAGVAADDESGAFAAIDDLQVVASDGTITVTGSPTFGGGEPVAITDGGGSTPGFAIVGATMTQVDASNMQFTMEVAQSIVPGGLYTIPIGVTGLGDLRLFAFANTTQDPAFQIADLSDGYSSTEITGSVEGTTMIWDVPLASLGASPGDQINQGAAALRNSLGASVSGVGSLQLASAAPIETADWVAEPFTIGGGMVVSVVGGDVDEVIRARVRRGVATAIIDELPAGTYTVTVWSAFADATFEQVVEVTI